MKKLHLSPDFTLPIDAATQTFAFIGRKGSGKTYGAGKLVEQLFGASVQVVILDTVGNWYGLRIDADGKREGLDIPVLGGLRGDIPLKVDAGAMVADLVCDTGRSVIIDISQFDAITEYKRFATAFGRRLWERKKAEREPSPLHLVIEESQTIIPQSPGPDDKQMLSIFERIVRLGRNYGIGASLITQRPQSVHKEALNQAEPLLAFQIAGAHERKAIKEWITHQGLDAKLLDELPGLPSGTCYFWSPQWLRILEKIKIGEKQTFDASATPKVGETRARRELAPLDLGEFEKQMQHAIAEAKENDPAALKKRIRDLEAKLAKPAVAAAAVDPGIVERARGEGVRSATRQILKDLNNFKKLADRARGTAEAAAAGISFIIDEIERGAGPWSTPRLRLAAPTQPVAARSIPVSRDLRIATVRPLPPFDGQAVRTADGYLPPGERAVLEACIQYPQGLRREQLTVLTGYKRSSRDAYIARLAQKTFVTVDGDRVMHTTAGAQALPDARPLPTGEELRRFWLDRLPPGEKAMLEQLLLCYPEAADREELTNVTGYKRSSRDAYLARLSAKQLVEDAGRGQVRATATIGDGGA